MHLKHLRITGFKSFSDPVELIIEPGLTGIVGPNGCGKSNVVDALRWAMGESSAKGLRGTGMDDVIFNGSAFRPAFDFAEVALRLEGPIDGLAGLGRLDEAVIVRRISRGSGSGYRINGREARARDVQLLFADAAAGARSAAIVGQGQISLMVEARPDERRRLLENAAGIGGLHARRREATLRLETTSANLERAQDLLDHQRRRVEDLERQARDALRFRRLAGRLRALEHLTAARRVAAAEAEVQRHQAEERRARVALGLVLERLGGAQGERDGLMRELAGDREALAVASELAARLSERMDAAREAAGRDRAVRADLALRCAAADRGLATEAVRQAELARSLAEETGRRAALEQALRDAAVEEERIRPALAALEEALARQERAQAERLDRIARLEAAGENEDRAAQALAARHERATAELAALAGDPDIRPLAALRDEMASLQGRIGAVGRDLEGAQAALGERERTLPGLRVALDEAEAGARAADAALAEAALALRAAQAEAGRQAAARAGLERRRARAAERVGALKGALDDAAARLAGAGLDAKEAALEAARLRVDTAAGAAAEADAALVPAEAAAARAQAAAGQADAALARARLEQAALAELVPEPAGSPLLDRLLFDEALGPAVAAMLGDDLLADATGAGAVHWRQVDAAAPADPALPAGVDSFAALVGGSALLDRRLAQTGLVAREKAAELVAGLRPGQRLVSLEGDLWRWDGFVRLAEAGGAAGRIAQRRRLLALRARIGALADEQATAAAGARAALAELEVVRDAQRRAAAGLDAAGRAHDAARLALQAAHSEADAAGREQARLATEFDQAVVEQAEAEAELAALRPAADPHDLAAAHGRLEVEAGDARRLVAPARSGLHEAEAKASRLRERVRRLGDELEQARARVSALALREAALAAELEAAAAALARDRARLEREVAVLADERDALAVRQAAARAALEEARRAAAAAGAELEAARRGCGEVRERGQALRLAIVLDRERLSGVAAAVARATAELAGSRERAGMLEAERAGVLAQQDRLGAEPEAGQVEALRLEHERAAEERDGLRQQVAGLEAALQRLEDALRAQDAEAVALRERLAGLSAELARAEALLAAAGTELRAAAELLQPGDEALLEGDDAAQAPAELERRIARQRAARDRLGAVNLRAAVELDEAQDLLGRTEREVQEVKGAVERLKRAIATLNQEARDRLVRAFAQVERHFQSMFTRLFGGGKAQLRLSNLEDPLNAGLELDAMPPGKRLTHVSLLSGGEKSLTGLALVYAFFLATPAPLCVLDEVDAPLDDANVDRFVMLTEEIARETGTRFLCVTHHPLTMARMNRLYGVTMVERGVSRLVSVALDEAVTLQQSAA